MKTQICENCEGEGTIDVFAGWSCMKSIDNCCGGCYDTIECDECNGSGEVEADDDDDED